jgi:hypothetical protein
LRHFSIIAGIIALGIELSVFLSLMELPPFGRGGSDIVWALPFFGLIIFALGISGLAAAFTERRNASRGRMLANAGLLLNGVTLAIPMLMIVLAVGRVLVPMSGLTHR